MDKLDGVRLKRKRARDQMKLLQAEIGAFLDGKPYIPSVKFDTKSSELIIKALLNKSADPMWGIQVGEIVHNLRSALDHIVWQLVIPDAKSKNQFPIFNDVGWFEKNGIGKFLRGVNSKAVELIRSEQPFPKEYGGTGEGIKCPLWHLKEFSDADKHRLIHVTGAFLHSFKFDFPPLKADAKVTRIVRREPGPMEQDSVLVRAHFAGFREWPFTESQVNCYLTSSVTFDHGTPATGWWEVIGTLIDIANRTERIIRRIAESIFKTEL